MVHSRKRTPEPVYPARPALRTDEQLQDECPYKAGSGCWHLWLWSQLILEKVNAPGFKVSKMDWAFYYPWPEAKQAMQDYKKSFKKCIVQIEQCISLVETNPSEESYSELSESIEAATNKIAKQIPSLKSNTPRNPLPVEQVPVEQRTKAMSKTEALNYIGWPAHCKNEKAAIYWLNKSIEDGVFTCVKTVSRKRFYWDKRQFPKECQREISQT